MILLSKDSFYYVYPSWAAFSWRWENLGTVFRDPIASGFLENGEKLKKLGYEDGCGQFELIDGPFGNGIIRGIMTKQSRFLWMAVMFHGANFVPLPGFPPDVWDYRVCWLHQKETPEQILGMEKKLRMYLPRISLDHDELPESCVFVALTFRRGRVDEQVCASFWEGCRNFGIECHPVESKNLHSKVAKRLASPVLTHEWFALKINADDVGLLAAKMFYLGCVAKQKSSDFRYVHVIGTLEGKPTMAQSWRDRNGALIYG